MEKSKDKQNHSKQHSKIHKLHDNNSQDHRQQDGGHEHRHADLEAWTKMYESGDFCDSQAHECLLKYQSQILSSKSEKLRIFLPLCGQSRDLKFLADMGHEVVGVEFVELAVKKFFVLNKIPFVIENAAPVKGKLYRSTDDKVNVKIYVCNIYSFKPDNGIVFDAIWDSGAMHSVSRSDLKQYVSIMKPLMNKPCPYLVEFTIPTCTGVNVNKRDLEELFGDGYEVEYLGSMNTERDYYKKWEIIGFDTFLIQNV